MRTVILILLAVASTYLAVGAGEAPDRTRGAIRQVLADISANLAAFSATLAAGLLFAVWAYFQEPKVPKVHVDMGIREVLSMVGREQVKDFNGLKLVPAAKTAATASTPSRGRGAASSAAVPAGPPTHIQCYNPGTGHLMGTVKVHSAEEVRAMVEDARAAQQEWVKTSYAERRRVLRMMMAAVREHADEICRLSALDTGKSRLDAYAGEVWVTCEKIKWVLEHGEATLAPEERETSFTSMHKIARVEYHPLGVLGVIAPWNYPFHNMYNHIVSGLFAGNAVVNKISEYSALSGQLFIKLGQQVLEQAGHSPALLQLVQGFGPTGSALVSSGVDKVIFTGSPGVGKLVMRGASETLTPVVLELGGKDPMVVTDDCDLDQAVHYAVRGGLQNCGQNCIGVERYYVYDSVHDEFVRRVVENIAQIRQGPPLTPEGEWDPNVDTGALTTAEQLRHVQAMVDEAVAQGARVLIGGSVNEELIEKTGGGLFYRPTVLVDVTNEMRIAQEEVFGPVLTVLRVPGDSDATALGMINHSQYGLGSSVFCKDVARAERIASQIYAGMVNVNDFGLNYLVQSLPFGGVKISGFDRFAGKEGLRGCCLLKSVITDRFPTLGIRTAIPPVMRYPTTKKTIPFVEGLCDMQYAPTLGGRIGGVLKVIQNS